MPVKRSFIDGSRIGEGVTDAKPRRKQTVDAWSSLADTVFVPHTEAEYQRLVTLLYRLVDEVGENESHPLASLMEIVGVLIEKYEDEHVPELPVE
jgi:HTH-type transcriptional regulator / antitoxin HigA